jgi:hypothetical protein
MSPFTEYMDHRLCQLTERRASRRAQAVLSWAGPSGAACEGLAGVRQLAEPLGEPSLGDLPEDKCGIVVHRSDRVTSFSRRCTVSWLTRLPERWRFIQLQIDALTDDGTNGDLFGS